MRVRCHLVSKENLWEYPNLIALFALPLKSRFSCPYESGCRTCWCEVKPEYDSWIRLPFRGTWIRRLDTGSCSSPPPALPAAPISLLRSVLLPH